MTTNETSMMVSSSPYAIMPVLDVQLAAARRQTIVDYTRRMMVPNVDYGVIPGTGDKPTLLKPGAEKLASLFGLSTNFDVVERDMDWTGEKHGGEPFFYLQYRCTLQRGDMVVGQGIGSCNSWEKKYRWRNVYPEKATEQDKASGRLETRQGRNGKPYSVYIVRNPDPADLVNTIDKMAQKRALVAAVLIAVNASELFTQDVEDYSDIVDGDWTPAPAAKPQPKPAAAPAKPQPQPAQADNGVQYGDGSAVATKALEYYDLYVAETGDAPENYNALRDWYKARQNEAAEQLRLTDAEPIGGAYAE